jgi:hypothetical protein
MRRLFVRRTSPRRSSSRRATACASGRSTPPKLWRRSWPRRLVEHLERSGFVMMKKTAQSEAERRLVAGPTGDVAALVTLREALGASTRRGVKRLRACRSAARRPDGRASTRRHPHFVEYPISSTRHRLAKIPFQCVRAVAMRFVRVPIRNFNFQRTVSDEFEALVFLELIMPAKMSFLSLTPAPPRGSHISLGQHYRQEHDKKKHNNYQDHRL